ncbi:3-oxoacyl-reductase [Xylariaceae sp. FL1651]|nr:3-oxoacyl-reductase [Xylariaceae sp. FL1651]
MSSTQQFANKVIALTGAASGIGLATAHTLASRGAKLSLADIQLEGLENVMSDLQSKYGAEVIISKVDVRKYDDVDAWIGNTIQTFGKLDGAANLAGVISRNLGLKTLADEDPDDWDFVIGVNLTGVMHCMKAEMRVIADKGSIVNASSIAGVTGRERNGGYSASKHGVLGLTRSAAKELGSKGVRVNAICPGRIATPMLGLCGQLAEGQQDVKGNSEEVDLSEIALRRNGQPEEVAYLIAFLLSDESTYMTGGTIAIDGGWNC